MDAAYLLDNGIYLIMWIGPNISSEWIQAVFNVQNPEHFESEKVRQNQILQLKIFSKNFYV